jgi:hypothetical protein
MRHQFTPQERSKGGKTRAAQESFTEMCEYGYQMLQLKNPYAAMWIYEQKVKPHMQRKQTSREAVQRATMQQGQLATKTPGKRRPMKGI